MKRWIYSIGGAVAAVAVVVMFATAWLWPVLTEVETGATPAYSELQPHYYSAEPARIYDEVVAAVEAMPRWEIVHAEASNRKVEAHRKRSPGMLGSVVSIRVEPVTEFVVQVHLHSATEGNLLPTDFGLNARHILEFYNELDDRLGAVKFEPGQRIEDTAEEGAMLAGSDEQSI